MGFSRFGSQQAAFWRRLAEEHGEVLAEWMREPAMRDDLCVQQALIAGHFALLYIGWLGEQTVEVAL